MASWAAPTPTPSRRSPHFFDLGYKPVLKTICARNADKAKAFADQWGYESSDTDWRRLVDDKSIDLIDIASPNDTHMEIAIAAAQGRQDGDVREAARPQRRRIAPRWSRRSRRAGVPNMVWYNYRRVPAVTLAKQLIDEGRLGKIFHYRAKFLQDWTISKDLPQGGAGPVAARRRRRGLAASPATCWRTASTPPCGSTAASTRSPA